MFTMQLAAVALALSGIGDPPPSGSSAANGPVLLDFQADWCGPCRSMENTVAQLAAAGYPVQKINIDQHRDLAKRYHIQAIPCFVLVSGGQEIDRIEGPATFAELQTLFSRARQNLPPAQSPQVRGQSPDGLPGAPGSFGPGTGGSNNFVAGAADASRPLNRGFGPSAGSIANAAPPTTSVSTAQLMAASVRLTVEDAAGFSYGSGTLVDFRQGNALVLTCGHIFRDSQGKGKITVDVYGPNPQPKLVGQLVGYDLKRDIGLVSIKPAVPVTTIPVAPAGYQVNVGDKVVSVGCDNGANPTARESKVNSLDKFLGPANLQVAGQPVQGRSGGGLFSASGFVIGVCNAADPADNEGLFAAASTIRAQLDQAGLASVYQRGPAASSAGTALADNASRTSGPSMPAQMPAAADLRAAAGNLVGGRAAALASAADALRQLSPQERATLSELRQKSQGAEVICIVRSLTDPKAKSEIIILDRASSAFLDQLSAERQTQDGRHLTSLEVPRSSPTAQPATAPSRPMPRPQGRLSAGNPAADAAAKKPAPGENSPSTSGGQSNPSGSRNWQPNWRISQ